MALLAVCWGLKVTGGAVGAGATRSKSHILRWLKELNYVSRRVCAENLFAPRALHNIVSESYPVVRQL